MAEYSKSKRMSDDDIKLMLERYDRGVSRDQYNRTQASEDLRFKVGDQWDKNERDRRGDRPALTFNRQLAFIRQVTGDIRQNKPSIRVRPNGDGADKDTAEMFAGLIRNIEQQSHAGYVYAQAGEAATSCGFGYFRIVTEYTTADTFTQDIRLKGIPNPLSVVCDPDAQELDRSDARWWFIYSKIPLEDFKKQYPDAPVEDFQKLDKSADTNDVYRDWYTSDGVRIAEYWCKEPVTKTLSLLSDGRTVCLEDYTDDKLASVLGGAEVVREREVKTHKVVQHVVAGRGELEDPTEWATDDIPIIPVLGEETWVDENRVSYGLIRYAKDAQRVYNYARSTSIEVTALQPKAPYVLSSTMIEGYEKMWQNAGNTNYPYLLFKSDPNMPGRSPERIQPPVPAAGLLAEAAHAADDMKAITGIYDAALGARSNETSGRAINARQKEGDVSTFVYIDNLALSIAAAGRQLVKLIPKIYDTQRVMRVLYDDGTDESIKVNVPGVDRRGNLGVRHDPKNGFYDLTVGKYDVVVEAGPGFTSRRQEAAEGIINMMQVIPAAAPLLGARLAELQDWPKASEIAKDLQKLLPPELRDPDPDQPPVQQQPPAPDPEMMKAEAAMQVAAEKHKFEVAKAQEELALEKQKAEADAAIAYQKAEADAALARDKAEFEMALEAWRAKQKAEMDEKAHALKVAQVREVRDVSGETKHEAMTMMLTEMIDRLSQPQPPRRRVLRTYRDENDNLIGEEHFADELPNV